MSFHKFPKMATPNGVTDFVPNLHVEAMLTVTPFKVTDDRRARQVLAEDPIGTGIFQRSFHTVLYYKNVTEEDSGWVFAGWATESLARALAEQPALAGRLRRVEDGTDGELEIVSNDSGVRLIEARSAVTLSEFLESKEKEKAEAELVSWKDIDEQNPQYSPLFYVQVTNFECGGYSIGISCSLLLADILVRENFLSRWANIHNNMFSENDVSKKPIYYLPNLIRTTAYSPTSIIGYTPSKNCGKTVIFNISTAENVTSGSELLKTLALLCIEEAELKLGRKMASDFHLFVKEHSNPKVTKVENCSKDGVFKPEQSLKSSHQVMSCAAGWDDLEAKEIAFRDGYKPVHVSYWIGSIFDGLVMAIPSPNEETVGMNFFVTIPNEKEN